MKESVEGWRLFTPRPPDALLKWTLQLEGVYVTVFYV
jgi:hypothetical protein